MTRRHATSSSSSRRARAAAILLCAALPSLVAARASAAGLERPNVVGARAVGMGGAFTAIADDPTAVWHNPAGTAMSGDNVAYVGGELVILNRTYTPDAKSPLGMAGVTGTITENTPPQFIPVIGVTTRFGFGKNPPTRFALSLAVYDAFGGTISYKPSDVKNRGILSTSATDVEVAPTLAYQVTDVFSVGAALRLGINSFSVDDNEAAMTANLSGSGFGIGASLGAMLRPHRMVQIGATYRTPLSASITGNGPVGIGSAAPTAQDFGVHITWPQSTSLGVTIFAHPRFLTSIQGDWTGWSSIQQLSLDVLGTSQVKQMRYQDSWAAHLGFQGIITRYLLARLGFAYDSNAIPDRDVRRENQDNFKATIAVGLGVHFWKLFIDAAFESLLPLPSRVVANDPSGENESGTYLGRVYSGELSAQIRF
jgi:long-chain fatty acid transport protein